MDWPTNCILCGCAYASVCKPLCQYCRQDLTPLPAENLLLTSTVRELLPKSLLHGLFAWYWYQWPVAQWCIANKFAENLCYARLLSQLTQTHLQQCCGLLPEDTVLMPVPLHRTRLLERGYNQVWQWLKYCQLPLTIDHQTLSRSRATAPQTEQSALVRRKNLSGAFVCQTKPPRHVLLVDDVVTTGSTLDGLAQSLYDAGCERVWGYAIALSHKLPARGEHPPHK